MVSIKMHNAEGRFAIGPSNILFSGVYLGTLYPGKFTGLGSDGVKVQQCIIITVVKSINENQITTPSLQPVDFVKDRPIYAYCQFGFGLEWCMCVNGTRYKLSYKVRKLHRRYVHVTAHFNGHDVTYCSACSLCSESSLLARFVFLSQALQ